MIRSADRRTWPLANLTVPKSLWFGVNRIRTISLGIVLIYTVSNRSGGWSSTKRADLAGWTAVVDPC